MFFFYSLAVLLLVYLAPAIALYPKLILSSRTIVATPFVSIAVVVVVQQLLVLGNIYNQSAVVTISIMLLMITVIRLIHLLRNINPSMLYWPTSHRFLLLFSLLLGSYWASELSTTGFAVDDELYSWNMWAIQHYLGHEIDFYYTQSPYPQLFPILISYCYKLLGSFELQMPVRALFALFPVALWGTIAIAPKEATFSNAVCSVIVMLALAAAIGSYFSVGLADPLMASSLVVAIFLFIQFSKTPDHRDLLMLSLICAAVAIHTKQAALIWALISFPIITLVATLKRQLPLVALLGAAVLMALGLAWVMGPGSGFHDNPGVTNRSQQDRSFIEQLSFAVQNNFFDQPLAPLFLIAGTVAVLRARRHRDVLLLFLLPALFAWLFYGAYSLRLGIHVVALAALLFAVTGYRLPTSLDMTLARNEGFVRRHALLISIIGLFLIGRASLHRIHKNVGEIGDNFSPYVSGLNTITKYFGKDAGFVFYELYNRPDLLLWVPSNYIYGIFYGHTPMIRPDYIARPDYSMKALLDEIEHHLPNYLFDAGTRVSFGPGSARLRELAENICPDLFEKNISPPNKYGYYTVYRLHDNSVLIGYCREKLKQQHSPHDE